MALVKAPNGDVYDLPDAVASGLVNSDGAGWEYYEEEKPAPKRARSSKSSEK